MKKAARKIDTLRVVALQLQAAELSERAMQLLEDMETSESTYRLPIIRVKAIACQRGSERLYQKVRALMGLEDHRGWLYTNGY